MAKKAKNLNFKNFCSPLLKGACFFLRKIFLKKILKNKLKKNLNKHTLCKEKIFIEKIHKKLQNFRPQFFLVYG